MLGPRTADAILFRIIRGGSEMELERSTSTDDARSFPYGEPTFFALTSPVSDGGVLFA
jgi:hypothetical protein